jgi:solute:Na+ symporter, SSS family
MLNFYDYWVIGGYYVLLFGLGWVYRRFGHDSSEYFRGGGQMTWWLVGASAFMSSFSAWTFTGAAGLAYQQGLIVLVIYLGNSLAFLINWAWLAALCRQMRTVVVMEAVRARLGRVNEQFFTWLTLPLQIIGSAITLYALAIFCSPVFGFELKAGILICGLAVVFVSAVGGSWAVATSDFLQALVLMSITVVTAAYSLVAVGGPSGLIEKLPATHWDMTASSAKEFGICWVLATLIQQVCSQNNLLGAASRYLSARHGKEARKAALLGAGLFAVGTVFWFIPPWVARAQGLNMAELFPTLAQPEEGAYVAMAHLYLPAGLMGLMITGMISSATSSMDHGLNRNSGIFVRSFYLPILRPGAGEKELVLIGRLTTVIFGMVVIALALMFSSWKNVGVLKLMLNVGVMLGIPSAVPMAWCLIVRRAPDWAAWSTVVLGLLMSCFISLAPTWGWMRDMCDFLHMNGVLGEMELRRYAWTAFANFFVGSIWYLAVTAFCGNRLSARRQEEVDAFFATMHRPLSESETGSEADVAQQSLRIGRTALLWGGFIALLLLIPNNWVGRLAILFCASFVAGVGAIIVASGQKSLRLSGTRSVDCLRQSPCSAVVTPSSKR